jgi:membrane-associated phospholipid phosphatase
MLLHQVKNPLFKGLLFIVISWVIILYAYYYIDSPVALHVKSFLDSSVTPSVTSLFNSYKELLSLIVMFDVIFFYIAQGLLVGCMLCPRKLQSSKIIYSTIVSSLSVILAYVLKDSLKMVFGRCCVKTVTSSSKLINTILSSKNAMVFHWFYGQAAGALFPSGHMTVACAFATSMCLFWPRLKIIWILFAVLMGIALIITNNHFMSDVLAGAFLGISISFLTYKLFNMVAPPKHSSPL